LLEELYRRIKYLYFLKTFFDNNLNLSKLPTINASFFFLLQPFIRRSIAKASPRVEKTSKKTTSIGNRNDVKADQAARCSAIQSSIESV